MVGKTTEPVSSAHPLPRRDEAPLVPMLVLAWSAVEPERMGEVAALDGAMRVVGRDLDEEPVRFFRQSPRGMAAAPPLRDSKVSRKHLVFRESPSGKLTVTNEGRVPLLVNSREAATSEIVEHDVLEIAGRYVFLVTYRPAALHGLGYDRALPHAFGEADAHGIVGESAAAWELREKIFGAAEADSHVLVLGASGTGKELAARAIHALSPRAKGPFVARNAATLPAGLVDAELFGNVKNYPNPGMPERPGLIGEASGGTLLLDEIAETTPELQAHLLRVLDTNGEYHRLGESRGRRAELRLIGATNRNIDALKHDLAPRFEKRVMVPSLDDRRDDLPLLARCILLEIARRTPTVAGRFVQVNDGRQDVRMTSALMTAILRRDYPTNVRDLGIFLHRAIEETSEGDVLAAPMETSTGKDAIADTTAEEESRPLTAEQVRAALERNGGKVVPAAADLGVSRFALRRLMKRDGIKP